MNRIFNLIWSTSKEIWIVVSEKVKGNGKVPSSPLRSLAVLTALFAAGEPAYAIDPGSLPSGGKITSGSGSIATSGTQMTVNQSSQQLIANWNSFNIGSNAAVRFNQPNTAASALNRITDQNPTQIMGSLSSNGQVYLLNPSGIIFGKTARVDVGGLVATSLNMLDSDFINGKNKFTAQGTSGSAGSILNQGAIKASDGGVVALIAPKVTNEGSITANSGTALLAAGKQVSLDFTGDGLINYTVDYGAVDAQVANKGLIKADGGVVVMTSKAADALRTATVTNTGIIEARTIQNKAGRILLLSDMQNGQTNVSGTLDASAPSGGNGGFIETSGNRVTVSDGTKVTTLAPQGKSGTWLLDPTDFTISSGSAAQTTSGVGATTLSNNLAGGDVTITTSSVQNGSDLGDIKVNAAVSWSANTLTLSALNNIIINANLNGSGTASLALNYGQGALAAGNTSTYSLTNGAQVNLPAGQYFSTKQGSDGTPKLYTVITSLGTETDATTGSNQTLQGMARSANLSGYFVLGSNIDASGTSTWNSNQGFTPIGSFSNKFTGNFDGLGHSISGLSIGRSADYVGFFGYTTGSVIRNVGIVGGSVTGYNIVGGLVGQNGGPIINSYATGSVKGSGNNVGGLVGANDVSTVTNSYATGSVTGQMYIGGLVGYSFGGITSSYATGSVTGQQYVGSLVGMSGSNITNSYATGSATLKMVGKTVASLGGLVGYNNGSITNSYATGSLTGNGDQVGGLVGYNTGSITNSYATGSVTGQNYVGGLLGWNQSGDITNSYATGRVTGTTYVGGLLGMNNTGTITNSYATGNVTGRVFANYLNETGIEVGGLVGYALSSTITNCYAMGSVTGRGDIGGLIGGNNFDCTITGSYATGNVTGNGDNVGGLAGCNYGNSIITNSYATGNVTGRGNVGGLVGQNWGDTIANSYAMGSVTGNGDNVGGLVGQNWGNTISNSYATGKVTGTTYVGGLLGWNDAGTITNSFWDTTTSGQSTSAGGIGKTSTQMRQLSTFGIWNTATPNTIANTGGSGAVWRIYEGHTTPLLTCFLKPLTITDAPDVTATYNGKSQSAHSTIKTSLVSGSAALGTNVGFYNGYYSNQQGYDIIGGNLIIIPKALTMSGLSVASSKIYDGTTNAVVTGTKTLSSEAAGTGTSTDGKSYTGDVVSLTGTAVGTYNSKDVATATTVTFSGLSLTGSKAANYTLTIQSPASARITPKALTMSGLSVAVSKVYDGTTNAVVTGSNTLATAESTGTGTAADGKSYIGDSVSIAGIAVGTYNSKDVATATKVTYSGLSLSGSHAGNYSLTSQSPANARITKKTVTLSASKTGDGTTTLGAGTVTIGTGVTVNGITELLGYSGASAFSKNIADNAINYIKTITLLNGTGGLAANYALPTLNHVNAPVTIH